MRLKQSFGIICCRLDKRGFNIVLIKKPITYYFIEFVFGYYRKSDEAHLKRLFNNMTYSEKMDILSMRFAIMWYRIYKNNPETTSNNSYISKNYLRKKTKFEMTFMHDGGEYLNRLIADTTNAETVWEIPKGRKYEQRHEEPIDTAMREFYEETRITEDHYEIQWHLTPYVETYSDFGTTYQNIFFYAKLVKDIEPGVKFSDGTQISEVCDVRWCSIQDILNMKLDKRTHNGLIRMFRLITKKYKNSRKRRVKLIT